MYKKTKMLSDFSIYFNILIFLTPLDAYSVKELRNIFQDEFCIEGNINSITSKLSDHKNEKDTSIDGILNLTLFGKTEASEKSVLSRLNELVDYNQIDSYFNLESEEGPAHNKLFTVKLTLGKETYFGQGKSHKKAKQDAAMKVFGKTEYESPPIKDKDEIEELTPTVLLNNVAFKLGIGVTYYLLDKNKEEILHSNIILTEKSKDYLKKLNSSIYADKNLRMKKDIDATKGPFRLKLKFGEQTFFVTSHSIQSGRHEVASMALDYLVKNKDNMDIACLKEGSEAECKQNKNDLKSPVSKVYEEAQKRKLGVEFEITKESGPPHKRTFITQCRLGGLVTTGEGKSKKESKKVAAINMLEKIAELEPLSIEAETKHLLGKSKNKKRNKKNKLIKTKLDEIEMVLDKVGKSVLGMATSIFGDSDESTKAADDFDSKRKSTNRHDGGIPRNNKKCFTEELLQLSKILNIKMSFSDFTEKDQSVSLLSLYTNPEYTCFGESISDTGARNIAAGNGLNLLNKMGIYDLFVEEKENSLKRETKDGVRVVLDQVVSKDKEEL
ncbi:double-stranded RNA-binding protein Staufen homolog [Diorhabda sublineata]|uniref:double-stranded RNA-binding protein Staufen homolog n=1 Tax=Diorhabda sublineata TaxID=1163346 RepID=UPI0024E08633|nr:double-stranded RNA-binding protein Staufen homolog [Diorhabda sublineata]